MTEPNQGEKEYLKHLSSILHPQKGLTWRDDCVIVSLNNGKSLLYTIDRPERIFFSDDQRYDMRRFGRWSAALVANDVIACGTDPRGISFDVGVGEMSVSDIDDWARGVLDVCEKYGMTYEGGNLGIGPGLTGVAWATEEDSRIIRRQGAQHGAILIATAVVGTGWAIRLWRAGKGAESKLGDYAYYQDQPWVNLDAFREIWNLGVIQAGMDITDGIIEFGYEIFEQEGLGVFFDPKYETPFPLQFIFDELGFPDKAAFFEAGYDTPFAHGWCVDPSSIELVTEVLRKHGVPFTLLGTVDERLDGVFCKDFEGTLVRLPRYWDDVLKPRGSIDRWTSEILPLFRG